MNELDRELFLLVNSASETNSIVSFGAYLIAKYIIFAVPMGLAALWITGGDAARRLALTLFVALVLSVLSSFAIGSIFPLQRPFLIPLGHNLMEHRASPSFPSNHALVIFSCAWTLFFMARRWQAVIIAVAGLLVAWSRVYLGVHWPFDMMGAAIVAGIAALVAVAMNRSFGGDALAATSRYYETFIERPVIRGWERLK